MAMPGLLKAWYKLLISSTATATEQSAEHTLPMLHDYTFLLDVSTATGGGTADVALQYKLVNAGTDYWYTFLRFAQVTWSAAGVRRIIFKPYLEGSDAGTEAAAGATGGALAAAVPLLSQTIRVNTTFGGSITASAYRVWVGGNIRGGKGC